MSPEWSRLIGRMRAAKKSIPLTPEIVKIPQKRSEQEGNGPLDLRAIGQLWKCSMASITHVSLLFFLINASGRSIFPGLINVPGTHISSDPPHRYLKPCEDEPLTC